MVGEAQKRKKRNSHGRVSAKKFIMVGKAQKRKKNFSWWGKHIKKKRNSHGGKSTKKHTQKF
jgi:hypothetical protein